VHKLFHERRPMRGPPLRHCNGPHFNLKRKRVNVEGRSGTSHARYATGSASPIGGEGRQPPIDTRVRTRLREQIERLSRHRRYAFQNESVMTQ
jgi:hypothetical protein